MTYRILFMGTPDFAVPTLKALIAAPDYTLVGVVTQPDRPAGRGRALQESPVKCTAQVAGIAVLQPEKLRAPGVFEQLQALQPDVIVVAAFGQILRQNVLDLPRFGCVNVHASLLPRWRGAAPIQAAIRAGDTRTGITIMKIDAGLDTGPILASRAIPIADADTGQTLHDKLAALGGPLLIETLDGYLAGHITPQPQEDAQSTYAPMLTKDDGRIDWSQSAAAIARQVRAYDPWPGTFTTWGSQLLKILGGSALPDLRANSADSGRITTITHNGASVITVGTPDGLFQLERVQLAGRSAVEIDAFARGYPAFLDARLG
ncbi:MAG: methionyl-tRNA formyltransferase [Aggregatilineales bacterium]